MRNSEKSFHYCQPKSLNLVKLLKALKKNIQAVHVCWREKKSDSRGGPGR